jgi:hypothetical protein
MCTAVFSADRQLNFGCQAACRDQQDQDQLKSSGGRQAVSLSVRKVLAGGASLLWVISTSGHQRCSVRNSLRDRQLTAFCLRVRVPGARCKLTGPTAGLALQTDGTDCRACLNKRVRATTAAPTCRQDVDPINPSLLRPVRQPSGPPPPPRVASPRCWPRRTVQRAELPA